MHNIPGGHFIGGVEFAGAGKAFSAMNPTTGKPLAPLFADATPSEVARAVEGAAAAFNSFRRMTGAPIARFVDAIADEIEALGDTLLERAYEETGLPRARLDGERARLVKQTRALAAMAREGSWVGARIDHGDSARIPPKPDVRTVCVGIGPVAVFGAGNFPLAISAGGTDTISAFAAGCPVIVKAHPAHPGTDALVGEAILRAAARTEMPAGVFSLVHGFGTEVGLALVEHPALAAVAFTGSQRGGRALYNAAAARRVPIPVYAEMSSVNPVFVLPRALAERPAAIAQAYVQSVTLGVGQFCTNPGLLVVTEGEGIGAFLAAVAEATHAVTPATMLHSGIHRAFCTAAERVAQTVGVDVVGRSHRAPLAARTEGATTIFATVAEILQSQPHLSEEVFGPSSLLVRCSSINELRAVATGLDGQLTASLHATPADLREHAELLAILETKVGRLVLNGFATSIEPCAAMHHGGPYPACTFSQFTSIGQAAVYRFVRPVCYQDFVDEALPEALREDNPLGLWRLVDQRVTDQPRVTPGRSIANESLPSSSR